MKNRISIEFDFDNNTPFIEILRYNQSGELNIDLRDRHIEFFFEKLGYDSSLVEVDFHLNECRDGKTVFQKIRLYPLNQQRLFGRKLEGLIIKDCLKAAPDYTEERPYNRLDLCSPIEKMMFEIVSEIEKIGADVKLTNAQIKIDEARKLIYEYYMSKNANISAK